MTMMYKKENTLLQRYSHHNVYCSKRNQTIFCLHACQSCGKVSCKHIQTVQTNNPQTKPVAGSPGKTGNTTSSQQHAQHSKDDFEQTRQSSFSMPWHNAQLHYHGNLFLCFSCWFQFKHNNFIQTEATHKFEFIVKLTFQGRMLL